MSNSPLGFNFHYIQSLIFVEGILDTKIQRKSSLVSNSQSLRSQMKWTSQLLLSPNPSLVNEDSTEASLSVAIPYNPRKANWRGWSPHHPSCQNLTLFPIPTMNWVFLLKSSQPIRITLHKPHPWLKFLQKQSLSPKTMESTMDSQQADWNHACAHTHIYIYLISNKLHRKKCKKIKRKKAHRQCARGNKEKN